MSEVPCPTHAGRRGRWWPQLHAGAPPLRSANGPSDEIAPLVLLPIELTVSVAVLLVAAAIAGERRPPAANRAALARLGVLNPGLAYAFGLAGLGLITASASAVLWAIEPVLIVVLA